MPTGSAGESGWVCVCMHMCHVCVHLCVLSARPSVYVWSGLPSLCICTYLCVCVWEYLFFVCMPLCVCVSVSYIFAQHRV